jgi:histidinol-phosphatase (PHP family)
MWSNFHTHSNYCDGKEGLGDYVSSALEKGLLSIGFSSHAPLPFTCSWCLRLEKLHDYLSELDTLKKNNPDLEIYKSLEIDFIPGVISPSGFNSFLDYTVGSIHFTDGFAGGGHWEIDGPHASFLEGLHSIFSGDMKHAVTRYFELTREMISNSHPTIVGHLDKIKIQNKNEFFFTESDPWYVKVVKETLDVIEKEGSIVEVNTRGIYQKKSHTTYPSPWILELIHNRNIPITISSDAHHPNDLVNQFPETAIMLRKIGFSKLTILHKNEWKSFDFDENGIIPGR